MVPLLLFLVEVGFSVKKRFNHLNPSKLISSIDHMAMHMKF